MALSVIYAISHSSTLDEPTLPALLRTRRYLRSIGRYGPGAFLVGQYGGAGEVAQGFCRYVYLKTVLPAEDSSACAVYGGTYVLGSQGEATSIDSDAEGVKLNIPCHSRPITAKHLVSSPGQLPPSLLLSGPEQRSTTAHCIAVLSSLPEILRKEATEGETSGEEQEDTAVIIVPPEDGRGLIRALIMGEATGSCPAGQCTCSKLFRCSRQTSSISAQQLSRPARPRSCSSLISPAYHKHPFSRHITYPIDPRATQLHHHHHQP